eukprot:CAMPEP_0119216386 /NCGR_PEP_ID=MMETSP1327-20130426/15116_1 /TAXON_ID=38833 /ORGANISM="Micromonas pusilla, Strain RCC2306" /LENGTH=135 /DNA_ID=CAMNT_0007214287 /DNA_START=37 /DNA_END=444 /DNA_ORIENTATION=+
MPNVTSCGKSLGAKCAAPKMTEENNTAPGVGNHFVSETNKKPRKTTSSSNGASTEVTVRTLTNRPAEPSPDRKRGNTASIVPGPWSLAAAAAGEDDAAVTDAACDATPLAVSLATPATPFAASPARLNTSCAPPA